MIMFDIDRFKDVNDTFGHTIGDHVLKTVADIVRNSMRQLDHFVRWGGDEFMIIATEADLNKAVALAERIRKIIESRHFEKVGKVTVSFGVTQFRKDDTEDSFIKRADDAMYMTKSDCRNIVKTS